MRRSTVTGIFVSILITICAVFPAGHAKAATVNLPPKAELEAAVARIEKFADYQKYYGANATPITSSTPYYQEYEYLHSLVTKTNLLITNYDDADFTVRNAEAYSIALTAIDQAIISCRYLFGIVYAESLAAQAAQSSPSSATPTATATQSPAQTSTATSTPSVTVATTTTPVIDSKTTTDDRPSNNTALTTFQSTESQNTDSNETENLPVEIPNTGSISGSSSVVFIVLVSFVAAIAATAIYFIYNRQQPKHATPTSHRKPRRRS